MYFQIIVHYVNFIFIPSSIAIFMDFLMFYTTRGIYIFLYLLGRNMDFYVMLC